jgi:hypothetical protein
MRRARALQMEIDTASERGKGWEGGEGTGLDKVGQSPADGDGYGERGRGREERELAWRR